MGKILVIVLFVMLTLFQHWVFAQNYQPLNGNSFQLFFQQTPINGFNYSTHNMWGTRIDSIFVSLNDDSVFFNYPIVRDTSLENNTQNESNFRCLWLDAPNWSSEKVIVTPFGESWFFNQHGGLAHLKHTQPVGTEWLAYTYNGGATLKATVDSVFWVDDGWTQDSVKSISFQRYTLAGDAEADIMNGLSVELYKNSGFRKTFDFSKFPFDTVSLYQLDVNYINKNATRNQAPQVGDIVTTHSGCDQFASTYPNNRTNISKKVLEVTPYPGGDSLEVLYQVNTLYTNSYVDYTTNPPHIETNESFSTTEVSENFILNPVDSFLSIIEGNRMPRENGAALYYRPEGGSLPCSYPDIHINSCPQLVFMEYPFIDSDSCFLAEIPFECNDGSNSYFSPYIGITEIESWSVNGSGWNGDQACYFETPYIKKGDFICGEYVFVGIQKNELLASISIYPNPASTQLTITGYTPAYIKLCNTLGQTVAEATNTNSLWLGNLPQGLYLLQLFDEKGNLVKTEKVVKE